MERFTYRVTIAYRGDAFHGFARQPGFDTVESVIVAALSPLVPNLEGLSVGGRTDRGVHATGQVISFWSRVALDPREIEEAIDTAKPGALAALEARWVPRRFHAQHSAQARRYVYFYPDDGTLHETHLNGVLLPLLGRRSFRAFARDTLPGASFERRLLEARARRVLLDGDPHIRFDFAADGFLRRQIRVLVATAIREVTLAAGDFALLRIAESGDRSATAPPAAAGGLYLTAVSYEALISRSRRGQLERPPLLLRR